MILFKIGTTITKGMVVARLPPGCWLAACSDDQLDLGDAVVVRDDGVSMVLEWSFGSLYIRAFPSLGLALEMRAQPHGPVGWTGAQGERWDLGERTLAVALGEALQWFVRSAGGAPDITTLCRSTS